MDSRGMQTLGRGDMTGARYRANLGAKEDRDLAVRKTISQLSAGDDIEIVKLPGGEAKAVTKDVARYLRGEIK